MFKSIKAHLRSKEKTNLKNLIDQETDDIKSDDDREYIEGERAISSVNKNLSIQSKLITWTVMVGTIIICIFLLIQFYSSQEFRSLRGQHKDVATVDKTKKSEMIIPFFTPSPNISVIAPPNIPPLPPIPTLALQRNPTSVHLYDQSKTSPLTPEERKRSTPVKFLIQKNNSEENGALPRRADFTSTGNATRADTLSEDLKPSYLPGVKALLIPDRNMFITRGAILDCTIEEAINTSAPGMISCYLSRDAYSASGLVVLLEKQTKITGEYRADIKGKDARLFIVWNRAETPAGVIIDLASPATDGLGRSGLDGVVDTHFMERFSAGILISVIGDASAALSNRSKSVEGNNNSVTFPNTTQHAQDMAIEAIKQNSGIPNTLKKNQAAHINIFVARDLDFRGVYALEETRKN